MTPHARRQLLGSLGIFSFLLLYIVIAATLADYLPASPWIKALYFGVVGTAWGVPLIPLLSWMNRDR